MLYQPLFHCFKPPFSVFQLVLWGERCLLTSLIVVSINYDMQYLFVGFYQNQYLPTLSCYLINYLSSPIKMLGLYVWHLYWSSQNILPKIFGSIMGLLKTFNIFCPCSNYYPQHWLYIQSVCVIACMGNPEDLFHLPKSPHPFLVICIK